MKRNILLRLAVVLVALALSAVRSEAVLISSITQNSNGSYTYSYTVNNGGGAFDISSFALELPLTTDLLDWTPYDISLGGDVSVPTDWIAFPGTPATTAFSQDFLSFSAASDVLIGQTLSGFSFTTFLVPGQVAYFEFSATGESASGTVLGPAATAPSTVPEGGSTCTLLAGTLAFFSFAKRRLKTA